MAVLRHGFTVPQARVAWLNVEPAMASAAVYMRSILAKARAILRRERSSAPNDPAPRP